MKRIVVAGALVVLAALLAVLLLERAPAPQEPTPPSPTPTVTDETPAPTPASVVLSSGKTITFEIPNGYTMTVAADGLRRARFITWSPDHRLFLGEMTSASDTTTGRVIVFDGFDPEAGKFAAMHVYLDDLRNPNSVAFYRDHSGQDWIYIALTDTLIRYPYRSGDLSPRGQPQIIATFPDFGPPASEGGWHLTRTLEFHGDTLFVSVGSGCNSCEEQNVTRADILVMDPDGSNSRVYASGLRNAVGIKYAKGALYATANEADHLGNDRPNDVVYMIEDGANYGWPYCYEFDGRVYADNTAMWQHPIDCMRVPLAFADLEPHSAPLGLEYFDTTFADPRLRDSFLVSEHGSGKPSIGTGYMVSIVRKDTWTPLITGFLSNGARVARPVDILRSDDRSFFVTDDQNGAIYYLRYR